MTCTKTNIGNHLNDLHQTDKKAQYITSVSVTQPRFYSKTQNIRLRLTPFKRSLLFFNLMRSDFFKTSYQLN